MAQLYRIALLLEMRSLLFAQERPELTAFEIGDVLAMLDDADMTSRKMMSSAIACAAASMREEMSLLEELRIREQLSRENMSEEWRGIPLMDIDDEAIDLIPYDALREDERLAVGFLWSNKMLLYSFHRRAPEEIIRIDARDGDEIRIELRIIAPPMIESDDAARMPGERAEIIIMPQAAFDENIEILIALIEKRCERIAIEKIDSPFEPFARDHQRRSIPSDERLDEMPSSHDRPKLGCGNFSALKAADRALDISAHPHAPDQKGFSY